MRGTLWASVSCPSHEAVTAVTLVHMTTEFAAHRRQYPGRTLNKVPEVDACFWIVKILCLTVGANFAEAVSGAAGTSLDTTAAIFLAAFAVTLVFQFSLDRHVAEAYWLTVTLAGAFAVSLAEVITAQWGISTSAATALLALLLAAVLAGWQAGEGTLRLDHIRSVNREAFYWAAVLVSFVLGETARLAAVEATDWSPFGTVLLPALACAGLLVAHRFGVPASINFWIAFTLTGSFGADLGDWVRAARSDGGLGLGTGATTGLFLVVIVMASAYSAVRSDRGNSAVQQSL